MSLRLPWLMRVGLCALWLSACSGAAPTLTATSAPTIAPTNAPPTATRELRVLCTAADDLCQTMTQAFEARTGVKTSFVRLSSGEALGRLRDSQANPEFDIWYGGPADAYVVAKKEGLLQAYVSPSAARISDPLKDAEGYWTGAYYGALGLCLNPAKLTEIGVAPPKSWADLLNPALKGQIAMAHPATSGTAYTALWTQVTLNNGNEQAAFDYFKQLTTNVLTYTRAGRLPAQMAGRGEIAVGITFSHDCVKSSEEEPQPLEVNFPTEGTGYEIGGLAIINGALNTASAKTYVDWALSKEAQEIPPTIHWYQLPTNPEATISKKSASSVNLVQYDFVAAGAKRDTLTKQFAADIAPAP